MKKAEHSVSQEDLKKLEEAKTILQGMFKGCDQIFGELPPDVYKDLVKQIIYRCYFAVLNLITLQEAIKKERYNENE
jgi:hypothetical protein